VVAFGIIMMMINFPARIAYMQPASHWDIEDEDIFEIEFTLIGNSTYDPTSIFSYWRIEPSDSFAFWDEAPRRETVLL
jgi:hypothetical protein